MPLFVQSVRFESVNCSGLYLNLRPPRPRKLSASACVAFAMPMTGRPAPTRLISEHRREPDRQEAVVAQLEGFRRPLVAVDVELRSGPPNRVDPDEGPLRDRLAGRVQHGDLARRRDHAQLE